MMPAPTGSWQAAPLRRLHHCTGGCCKHWRRASLRPARQAARWSSSNTLRVVALAMSAGSCRRSLAI